MNKNLYQLQYSRLSSVYRKLNNRLQKHFAKGTFSKLAKRKQEEMISRVMRMRERLQKLETVLKLSASGLALGAVLMTSTVQAQFAPVGSEFLVNSYTTSDQKNSSIAMDADGDFVITWQSSAQNGIYAQRYNSTGVAQGAEFLVNTYTTNYQSFPSIAMDSDGDFVITWESYGQDGNGRGIYAQRYNSTGVAQGAEFQVNTFTSDNQRFPSIAMDADGDFVITWTSMNQDGELDGIYAQRYNASGVAQGSEFQVNTYTTSFQRNSSIAMDADGDFVITWESNGQGGAGGGFEIYAQRYNASAIAQGGEFLVNTYTTSSQREPLIAMDSDGDFVIVWNGYYQDSPADADIYAQRYNASGVAQGGEFLVNTYTTNYQYYPSIAMDSDGDFVITWNSDSQDGSNYGIYAQRYNSSGVAQGSEFLVNTHTTSNQYNPSTAMDSDGDFVIVWQSSSQDGSNYGIYAQRYTGGFVTSLQAGMEELNQAFLYPNPAKNKVNMDLEGVVSITVKDASGRILLETSTESGSFNTESLAPGLYFATLSKGDSEVTKKLVVE